MKTVLYKNALGEIVIRTIVESTNETELQIMNRLIAKGKLVANQFIGVFEINPLPPMPAAYERARRFSAGAFIVKMGLASDLRWEAMKQESRQKLLATDAAMMQALETGSANPVLAQYRSRLRAIIAVKPVVLNAAQNISALDAVRPMVLDEPLP